MSTWKTTHIFHFNSPLKKNRDVMIPMQKNQRPLAQNDEPGVDQLDHLGHGELLCPIAGDTLRVRSCTNGVNKGIGVDGPGKWFLTFNKKIFLIMIKKKLLTRKTLAPYEPCPWPKRWPAQGSTKTMPGQAQTASGCSWTEFWTILNFKKKQIFHSIEAEFKKKSRPNFFGVTYQT